MEICSLGFLLAVVAIVVCFHLLPLARLRRVFLGIVNGLFLLPLVPNLQSWIWFVVFLGGTYGVLALVRARPRRATVWMTIVVVVALFTYVKRYSFIQVIVPVELWWAVWNQPVAVVGLSYMLFKFIHMLVDQSQGQLAPFTFASYVNYQLAFFTLVAGPIQRYNDFARGWEEMDLAAADAGESWLAWNRILTGLIKMRVLAPLVLYASADAARRMAAGEGNRALDSLIVFYAFPVQLYFNFAGYTDAAIGSARLLGFALPENFNRPYLARNVLDFWNRWHMSLTRWIRDYVFMTSYKAAATAWPRGARYWSYGLLFVALFITGIWHGTTSGFIVFGVLNGIGVAVNRAYGDFLKAVLGRAGIERYLANRAIRSVAIVMTFHYVCFCHLAFAAPAPWTTWYVFTQAVRQAAAVAPAIAALLWSPAGVGAAVIALLILAGLWQADALGGVAARLAVWLASGTNRVSSVVAIQAVVVTLFFFLDWTVERAPPRVVYMKF